LQALIDFARLVLLRVRDGFERSKLALELCELGFGFSSTLPLI